MGLWQAHRKKHLQFLTAIFDLIKSTALKKAELFLCYDALTHKTGQHYLLFRFNPEEVRRPMAKCGISRRNKNTRRPIKSGGNKRARIKVQKKRLVSLGLPEDQVTKLNSMQIRDLLRHPAKLAKA